MTDRGTGGTSVGTLVPASAIHRWRCIPAPPLTYARASYDAASLTTR
jgi:hypothetical protein